MTEKACLTTNLLRSHGITFHGDETELPSSLRSLDLPDHVIPLCEELLMFEKSLLKQDVDDLHLGHEERNIIPITAYAEASPIHQLTMQGRRNDATIELAFKLFSEAAELSGRMLREKEWTRLLRDLVFKDQTRRSGTGKYSEMADQVKAAGEDVVWNDSTIIRNLAKDLVQLKHPKPDIYVGFPICEPESGKGFLRTPIFENFTADVLYRLSFDGLTSTMTSPFRGQMSMRNKVTIGRPKLNNPQNRIMDCDLLCFPWVIVEVKRENAPAHEKEYGCCQAANSASVSLSVMEKLVRYDDTQQETQNVPPVFTFTAVGADIRLWVAYSASTEVGYRKHRMTCIWRGSIRKFWGAFQFCQIVDKLYFWAIRILKPQISNQIDHWRRRQIFGVGILRPMLAQERNAGISEIVDRIEHRLSTFNISTLKPEALITQIIIQQELLLQFKAAGSPNKTSFSVFNNAISPSTAKQPGQKSVNGRESTSSRSSRKSAPEMLLIPRHESGFSGRRTSDPPKPGSHTRASSHSCKSPFECDSLLPSEEPLHALEDGQSKLRVIHRSTPKLSLSKRAANIAPEVSSSGCKAGPIRLCKSADAKKLCPTAPNRPVSASGNLSGQCPPWVYGDWQARLDKGSFEEGFQFAGRAADTFAGQSLKPIAQPRGRPRSRSHADRPKEPKVILNEVTPRIMTPPTPISPFLPMRHDTISLEDNGKGGLEKSGVAKVEAGYDAVEIPDSQEYSSELSSPSW